MAASALLRSTVRTAATARHVSTTSYDVVVVGGGIVGLAAAQELAHRYPELTLAVVEKESSLATHQTGHNSGVIHAGIYYKPGSLMAKLCVEGLHSTYRYCDKHKIPYKKCGKLVVATNALEVSRLDDLFSRAQANGVPDIEMVDAKDIHKYEPVCTGLKAIWSPHTGIVDWAVVARQYAKVFESTGGIVHTDFDVRAFRSSGDANRPVAVVDSKDRSISASYVLCCAGLYADRVAAMSGCSAEPKIVPFRGEYLLLSEDKAKQIRGNIYPVPDPAFPFLGVHFTPRMNGEVWLGPNAVPAFSREGYKWETINQADLSEMVSYPGFYRLAAKYASFGLGEIARSFFTRLAVRDLQKFVPSVRAGDVRRGPAGVRAQAMTERGELVGDFVFHTADASKEEVDKAEAGVAGRVLHCRNAPSPGATSSLAIGRMMADHVQKQFGLPARNKAQLY